MKNLLYDVSEKINKTDINDSCINTIFCQIFLTIKKNIKDIYLMKKPFGQKKELWLQKKMLIIFITL